MKITIEISDESIQKIVDGLVEHYDIKDLTVAKLKALPELVAWLEGDAEYYFESVFAEDFGDDVLDSLLGPLGWTVPDYS